MRHYTPLSIRALGDLAPRLGQRVLVDPSAVVIGDVALGDDCSVWPQASVRGDVHSISVGARSNVQDGAVLHVSHRGPQHPAGFALTIGEEVTIGHRAILHGCQLGSRIIVGMAAVVMDGAVVEDDVLIAANTLVPPGKRLASGFLYKGTAQQARPLTPAEIEGLRYSALHYVGVKERHLQALEGELAGREAPGAPGR